MSTAGAPEDRRSNERQRLATERTLMSETGHHRSLQLTIEVHGSPKSPLVMVIVLAQAPALSSNQKVRSLHH